MSFGYLNLYIKCGDDFSQEITLTDASSNPINLVNYTVAANVKRSYYTSNVTAEFSVTETDPANGVITLSLPRSVTGYVWPNSYLYDIKGLDGTTNLSSTILSGTAIFMGSTTYIP